MTFMIPASKKQSDFVQEYLYVEDQYQPLIPKLYEPTEADDDKRGVIIIDLL